MKVIELLKAFEDQEYTDVVIIDGDAVSDGEYGEDNLLATWDHKEHNHWYYGQLDYLTTLDPNPLTKYYSYSVRHFTVLNDFDINGICCIYITI